MGFANGAFRNLAALDWVVLWWRTPSKRRFYRHSFSVSRGVVSLYFGRASVLALVAKVLMQTLRREHSMRREWMLVDAGFFEAWFGCRQR